MVARKDKCGDISLFLVLCIDWFNNLSTSWTAWLHSKSLTYLFKVWIKNFWLRPLVVPRVELTEKPSRCAGYLIFCVLFKVYPIVSVAFVYEYVLYVGYMFIFANLLNFLLSPGAMLLLWAEAIQAGNFTYSLQLHPVSGSVGRAGLQFRLRQCQLLSVCGAVHQDPASRGEEQEEEGEAAFSI